MNLNFGYVANDGGLEFGYSGAYTGGTIYPYELTSHGEAHPNSIMADANFATTGTVEIRIISDFDPAKVEFDWQAFSDQQLWRDDVNTLAAVTVNSATDTTDSATIGWKTPDGTEGQFTTTLNIAAPDEVAPTVESVAVPTAGTYTPGDTLTFTVNWSEAVTVTGTPAINLDVGGSPRQANYSAGTGTSATAFTYTVQSGDLDTDGVTVTSLTLEGGTIKDSAGNDATLTLNAVGDTSGVLVDGVAPVISINSLTTLDTSPVVSGSAGDAVSLTLVVNDVTYTPTPADGSWSQQLPTLALDDYIMTLNGVDAAGNAAVERTATLKVVDKIVEEDGGLFQPLFRPLGKSLFSNLFR